MQAVEAALNSRPRKTLEWKTQQKPSTSTYSCSARAMLQSPVEPSQCTSIRTERLADAGVLPSIGSVGDSYDCESVDHRPVQDRGHPSARTLEDLDDVEIATLEWVEWFNNRRLFEALRQVPPAEATYYRHEQPAETLSWGQQALH